jgi:hypothetical protein
MTANDLRNKRHTAGSLNLQCGPQAKSACTVAALSRGRSSPNPLVMVSTYVAGAFYNSLPPRRRRCTARSFRCGSGCWRCV